MNNPTDNKPGLVDELEALALHKRGYGLRHCIVQHDLRDRILSALRSHERMREALAEARVYVFAAITHSPAERESALRIIDTALQETDNVTG